MNSVKSFARLTAFTGVLLLTACAGPKAPDGVAQVRDNLTQLQTDPQLASLAPVAIREAEQAVRLAEEPRDDKGLAKHFLYLAERKVETARALAQARYLEDQRGQINERATAARLNARTQETEALRRQLTELNAKQTERGLILTLGDVLFETGKYNLRTSAENNLTKLVEFLQQQPDRALVIEGHTDSVGSDTYNQDLSQRRADSVKAYLVSQGVAPGKITAIGKGESSPVASNDSSSGRQLNRRVEIIIPDQ